MKSTLAGIKKTSWVALFFILAFIILAHQYVNFGVLFELADIHHETFAIAAVCLGLGILMGKK